MRRRLVWTTSLIALVALLVLGVPLGVVESHRAHSDEVARLEREADTVAASVDDRVERGQRLTERDLAPLVPANHRVDLVTQTQRVRAGNVPGGSTISARSASVKDIDVTVTAPAGAISEHSRHVWELIVALVLAGTAAAAALAALQARRLVRPLDHLIATSTRLGQGDFSARSGPLPVAEFDRVAAALDSAAAQIAQLVGRQREFAANVSHQLRSPLTALRLRLEEMTQLEDPQAAHQEADAALAVADRLERTVADLLALAREGDIGTPRDVDLAAMAREHASLWRPVFARAGRTLSLEAADRLPVRVSPGGIAQALDVLLENALTHGAGPTQLRARSAEGRAVLEVADEGTGIPSDLEDEIFSHRVSTGDGTGLGLPLARALVEADGAHLELTSARPPRFEIFVPLRS